MTSKEQETGHLEDIRARASADYTPLANSRGLSRTFPAAACDMAWLMAEVDRLRSLVTRVAQSNQLHLRSCGTECAAECPQAQIDKLAKLQTEVRCDACLGVPQTDILCGCGGTGLLADMLTTTRQELAVARAELVELRRWNTKMLEDRNRALDELRALKKAFAELRQQR